MPEYGESPELLETRARLAAARAARRGPVVKALLGRRDQRDVVAAYQAVFFPEGALHPAAAIVLDDLAYHAGFGAACPVLDFGEMCVLEGQRRLLLHLLSRFRLSPERAAALETELEKSR